MSGLLAPDSPAMRVLTRIADLMILNVVFIATSLPVVTLGAALTALQSVTLRIVGDRDRTIVGDYLASFRRNFRQGTAVTGILLAMAAVFAAWYVVVTEVADAGILRLLLLAAWYLLLFLATMTALYVFPYLATFEGSVREVLDTSRRLSLRHPLAPLTVIVVTALAVVATIFAPQATGYGLLWLMIGFSGISYLGAVLYARVFVIYAPSLAAARPGDDEAADGQD